SAAKKWLVPAHRHTMGIALVGPVIEQGVMLGTPVVPEGDRAYLPTEAAVEFRRLDVPIEHFEDGVALLRLELRDARCEAAVDEQSFAATDRVCAHNWMLMTGKLHVAAL